MAEICGAPTYDPATDAGLYLWEESCGGVTRDYSVRATAGGNTVAVAYEGLVDADQAFIGLSGFSLERTDLLELLEDGDQIRYQLNVRTTYEDGFGFSMANGTNSCFGLDLPVGTEVLLGPEATPLVTPFSLPSLGKCTL